MTSDPKTTPWGAIAYRVARSRLGGVPDFHRDDAMSELYMIAWQTWREYDPSRQSKDDPKGQEGFTASVVFKRTASAQRRYGPKTRGGRPRTDWSIYGGGEIDGDEMDRLVGTSIPPDRHLESESTHKLLRQLMAELRPEDAEILTRYYIDGDTVTDISADADISVPAGSQRLKAARRRLLDLTTSIGLDASDLL